MVLITASAGDAVDLVRWLATVNSFREVYRSSAGQKVYQVWRGAGNTFGKSVRRLQRAEVIDTHVCGLWCLKCRSKRYLPVNPGNLCQRCATCDKSLTLLAPTLFPPSYKYGGFADRVRGVF